MTAFARL